MEGRHPISKEHINLAAIVPYRVYPAKMGGQKGIALFYRFLSGKAPVTIFSTSSNEYPSDTDSRYISLMSDSGTRYANPLLFFRMRKQILQNRFTHLLLEHPYMGWLGLLLKWTTPIKLVIHSHNIESLRFKSTGKWWWGILWHYEKWVHRLADQSFFITEEDKTYASKRYGLPPEKGHVITYGIEMPAIPSSGERQAARRKLEQSYGIAEEETIMLFNGTLDYPPNTEALVYIIREINPRLMQMTGKRYRILICGKNLPASFHQNEKGYLADNIQYAGFVDDINIFFLGADVFLNPVTDGGGIKTKLVEALGYNLSAVSSRNGAIGVDPGLCPGKLLVVDNTDWDGFAKAVSEIKISENTAPAFFNRFYWANIADRAVDILRK